MVSLRVDDKERIWASLADEKIFKALSKNGTEQMKNQDVTGTVYRLKLAGTYLLTDDFYIGCPPIRALSRAASWGSCQRTSDRGSSRWGLEPFVETKSSRGDFK